MHERRFPAPGSLVRAAARGARRAILGLLYPPLCTGCGARLAHEQEAPLCQRCLSHLERPELDVINARLARLPEARSVLDAATVLWIFDKGGTLQRVQHALKYGDRPYYGLLLGRLVGDTCRECLPLPHCVLPVPLHRARLLQRGYNQSDWLAEGVAQALAVPVQSGLLRRTRATRSQTTLSRRDRWQNVAEAFAVADAEHVAGRSLLLIDDVLTTGATAVAAAHVLKQAGARHVSLATLALARD